MLAFWQNGIGRKEGRSARRERERGREREEEAEKKRSVPVTER